MLHHKLFETRLVVSDYGLETSANQYIPVQQMSRGPGITSGVTSGAFDGVVAIGGADKNC